MSLRIMLGAIGLLVAGQPAWSATLLGDSVTYTLTQGIPIANGSVTVGAGPELFLPGSLSVDLNAGPAGDRFVFHSGGSVFSFNGLGPDPVVWTFTGLDFSGGHVLTGFEILSDLIDSPISIVTTAHSLVLSYAPQDHRPGDMIVGRFVTAAQVPVPATLPLLALAMGAVAALRRRPRNARG